MRLHVRTYLHERKPLRHKFLTIVHNENSTYVQLDIVVLLLVCTFEHIKGRPLWDEHYSPEL